MFRNISDVLKSSAEVLEKLNDQGDKSKWRSLDRKRVNTSDGRRVYKLVEVKGFFSYLVNHVKYLFFASDYKKSMEEVLNTPKIEKNLKDRRVADVNAGVVPAVRNIQGKEVLPTITGRQEISNQATLSTDHTADSDYETASDISEVSDLLDRDEMEPAYDARRTEDDAGYADDPVIYGHSSAVTDRSDDHAPGTLESDSSFTPLSYDASPDTETLDRELQQALARSRMTEITDEERRSAREANDIEEAMRRSNATFLEENDTDLAQALALSHETLHSDELKRQASEQKRIEETAHHSTQHPLPDGDDADLVQALVASKHSEAEDQEKRARQEQQAAILLKKYDRDIVRTVRDGDCFYDGMAKMHGHSSVMNLRNKCYQEGLNSLRGNGKIEIPKAYDEFFKPQIEQLKKAKNYAEQIDIRLMAVVEHCTIIVCDLNERVMSVVDADGGLEEYPQKSLRDVMRQSPDAELFVLATGKSEHYIGSTKRQP